MKYGKAISAAFSTLKSGSLWGFAATTYAALAAVFIVPIGGAIAASDLSRLANLRIDSPAEFGMLLAPLAMIGGAVLLAFILSIPLTLIMQGGFIHLTDEVLAKRPVSVGQAWSFGARRMGRTFAIDFVIGMVAFVLILVALIPFVVGIAGIAAGSDSGTPSGGALVGVCCGYLVFLLFAVALSLLITGYEAIALRYGLVGTRTAGEALGAGWQAFKARWKNVVVFSLIVLGLGYAYNIVTSVITGPLQFFLLPNAFTTSGSFSADEAQRFIVGYPVFMAVAFVIAVPLTIFQYSLWSAFFRQLTGLDVFAEQPAAPIAPAAPTTPAPPAAPEPPVAAQPSAPAEALASAEPPAPPAPPAAPEPPAAENPGVDG